MLYVRVNDVWRKVLYIVSHPTGARYALMPIEGEPDTVSMEEIARTPWNKRIRTPQPLPKLVS